MQRLPDYRRRCISTCAALATAVVAWILSEFGAFDATDGPAYDLLLRWLNTIKVLPARVLLVATSHSLSDYSDTELNTTLDKLRNLGCKAVALTFPPENNLYTKLSPENKAVTVFPDLRIDAATSLLDKNSEALANSRADQFAGAALIQVPTQKGIQRNCQGFIQIQNTRYIALEYVAAQLDSDYHKIPIPEDYKVHFRGDSGSLPILTVDSILSGDIVENLVKNNIVLIGSVEDSNRHYIHTPTTTANYPMTALEFHGHALNTILNNSEIKNASNIARVVSLLLVLIVAKYLHSFVRPGSDYIASAICITTVITCCTLIFISTKLWLPLSENVLCAVITLCASQSKKALTLTKYLEQTVADSTISGRDKLWPLSTASNDSPWESVASMINQTLDVKRQILLRIDKESSKLQKVVANNCVVDDIDENMLSTTCILYKDAWAKKGPIAVQQYIQCCGKSEKQFVVMLSYFQEPLGVWALSIESSTLATLQSFERVISYYASKISENLSANINPEH